MGKIMNYNLIGYFIANGKIVFFVRRKTVMPY